MIVLGLLLLLASGALAVEVVMSNTGPATVEAFGYTLSNITLSGLFLAGAATGLLVMLGVMLLLAGTSRTRSRRVTARHVRSTRRENEHLQEENAALRARLDGDPYPSDTEADDADVSDSVRSS